MPASRVRLPNGWPRGRGRSGRRTRGPAPPSPVRGDVFAARNPIVMTPAKNDPPNMPPLRGFLVWWGAGLQRCRAYGALGDAQRKRCDRMIRELDHKSTLAKASAGQERWRATAPRVQPLGKRTLETGVDYNRTPPVFREGAENHARGGRAPLMRGVRRRAATRRTLAPTPWAEAHGYHHAVAPRPRFRRRAATGGGGRGQFLLQH